jgi:excisionase family DNA binding protein
MTDTTITQSDLLYGANAIADFLGVKRSIVYHLIETKRLPSFKVGKVVCARRSTVTAAFERLEQEPLSAA